MGELASILFAHRARCLRPRRAADTRDRYLSRHLQHRSLLPPCMGPASRVQGRPPRRRRTRASGASPWPAIRRDRSRIARRHRHSTRSERDNRRWKISAGRDHSVRDRWWSCALPFRRALRGLAPLTRPPRRLRSLLGDSLMPERAVKIVNKQGIHARPAAEIVKTAARFRSEITIVRDDMEVNGKSIMGVMMLAAECGAEIIIRAEGDDADAAIEVLAALIVGGFGE